MDNCVLNIWESGFVFVSCFGFRISNLSAKHFSVSLWLVNKSEYWNLVRIDFFRKFGILPAIQPSWLWNQACSAFFLPSKESVAMAPKPTSVLLVEAWSLIPTDSYSYMLPIDIFFSTRRASNATFVPFLSAQVRLLMEEPPRSTPGFLATAGEWPSVVNAANILAGTMKRCRLSSGPENFGEFWFLI